MSRTAFHSRDYFSQGLNDTKFARNRELGQAKTQTNFRVTADKALEKALGRQKIASAFADTINGIFVPPRKVPVVTIGSANDKFFFFIDKVGLNSATVAHGDYFSYSTLGVAMTAACVDQGLLFYYDPNGSFFEIGVDTELTNWFINWAYPGTTFDPTIIGATQLDICSGSGGHPGRALDMIWWGPDIGTNPRIDPIICCPTKWYESDKSEITLPDATSVGPGSGVPSGVWYYDKLYISDGSKNIIIRDEYARLMPDETKIKFGQNDITTVTDPQYGYNNDTAGAATAVDQFAFVAVRVPLAKTAGAAVGGIVLFDTVKLRLSKDTTKRDSWTLMVYLDDEDYGLTYLAGTVSPSDLPSDGAEAEITLTVTPAIGISQLATTNGYLRLVMVTDEPDPADCSLEIGYKGTAAPYETLTSAEVWTASAHDLMAVVRCSEFSYAAAGEVVKYKFALQNADGFVTWLTESYLQFTSAGAATTVTRFELLYENVKRYDFKYLNIYKTESDGAVFWLVAQLREEVVKDLIATNGKVMVFDGMSDANLITGEQADVTNYRTAILPFTMSTWWMESLWVVSGHHLYWSGFPDGLPSPESFNIADDQMVPAGDGTPITALGAVGGLLIVFHLTTFVALEPYGDTYKIMHASNQGIGTTSHRSVVGVQSNQGAAVFFQGQNGHIYLTDGINQSNLTGTDFDAAGVGTPGRLQEFVDSLNKSALDQTVAYYDPDKEEITWSVCTGTNTTPDTNIVYQIANKSFYLSTMPADCWAISAITSAWTGQAIALGAHNKALFYGGVAYGDYNPATDAEDGDISAEWQSCDWPLRAFDQPKDIHHGELTAMADIDTDAIEGITLAGASPVSITATAHGLSTGDVVKFASVGGTTGLNDNTYTITKTGTNTFTLDGTVSSGFSAWTSGGTFVVHPAVTLNWYMDEATAATVTKAINITAGGYADEYRSYINKRGRTIRAGVVCNGNDGPIKFNQIVFDVTDIREARRK